MKIKSIAAICKKNKRVVLFNRYSESGTLSQYIGDGSAVYPISGLPEPDEESVLTIFDVPEKQREDWFVRYRDIPEGISFGDTDANEKIIEQGNLITAQFVRGVQDLVRQCAAALAEKEEKRRREAIIDPQYSFNVDPETGEVIDPESEVTQE